MESYIRKNKISYLNVTSVQRHSSIKVLWLFMALLIQMKDHLHAANVIESIRKSMKKIIMNNSVEFHMNSHVNTNSVTLHMQTQNCTMSIYVENIARARKVSLGVHIAQKHLNTAMVDYCTSKSINLFCKFSIMNDFNVNLYKSCTVYTRL